MEFTLHLLVEFDDEVWVQDYKLGGSEDAARYRAVHPDNANR